MPMPGPLATGATIGAGASATGTTGGGVVTTGNRHPGAGACAAVAAAADVTAGFAAAAAAAAVPAHNADREAELPSALSDTSGSSVARVTAGAAYTAWLETIAATPVAKIAVRILDVIDLPRSAKMAVNCFRMDVTPNEANGCDTFLTSPSRCFSSS